MKNKLFKSLFAFMFVVCSGLVLTACGTLDIDASKIKVGETTFTYDGYSHVCEIDYEVADVTVSVTYSETLDGEFKPADELNYIDAGTYNVYYKISAVGYNDYVSQEKVGFTISPKAIDVTVNNVEIVRSNMGSVTPAINPGYTADGVVFNDDLGLTFAIGDKVGTVNTPFDATNALVGEEYFITATSTNGNYTVTFNDSRVKIIDAVEYVNSDGATAYSSNLSTAFSVAKNDTTIKLHSDLVLLSNVHIASGEYTIDLNGHRVSFPSDEEGCGIFWVENDGKLTINDTVGTAVVNSASQNNDYSMAVWANNGGEVIINGGTFRNVGAKDKESDGITPNNNELIYASREGKITINGGTFVGNYENDIYGGNDLTGYVRFTLNEKDENASTEAIESGEIIVTGGQFRQYDPADSKSENPAGNFVADGYTSTPVELDGVTWYIVTANI